MQAHTKDATVNGGDWKGIAAHGWVAAQDILDRMFQPLQDLLADEVARHAPTRILDVGCGTGATTLAAARRLGGQGEAVGVDLSEDMIAAARARLAGSGLDCRLLCADAQRHPFAPESVDLLISRFGVMFFDDPVAAFGNLHAAMRAGGAMSCIVWQGPEANAFMTAAEVAAEPLLPGVSRRVPDAPGQFGFANRDRVHTLLQRSGWCDISIDPLGVTCAFPASELDHYLLHLGPVGRRLAGMHPAERARVLDVVRPAFTRFIQGDEVRFLAACWCVRARAMRR